MYASGPGFFIFFHETETSAGGGEPTLIIYTKEQKPVEIEKDTFKKVSKKLKQYKKKKRVSQETIYNIAQTMADSFSAKPTMERYGVSYEEAVSRYKDIISEIAYIIATDEEEALILIMANI